MSDTSKTTSIKNYIAVSDKFVGPLTPNQVRVSAINKYIFEYDNIDYSQLSEKELRKSADGLVGLGQLSYKNSYTDGKATINGEINYYEPDPSAVVNYWANQGVLNSSDFVYPKDEASGKSLGAWPKNYKDYPTQLIDMNLYNGNYIWPISTSSGAYQTAYDHTGIDIHADFGTPVYAPCDGEIVYSTWGETANKDTDESAYSVTITPDEQIEFDGVKIDEVFLTHMSGIRYRCERDDGSHIKIKKGELLGFSGTAAGSRESNGSEDYGKYGPHLHVTYYNSHNYDGGLTTPKMEEFYGIKEGDNRLAGK